MKTGLKIVTVLALSLGILVSSVHAVEQVQKSSNERSSNERSSNENNAWLKQQFSEKHQQLIPVVAVADMFFSCNRERKVDPIGYQLKELITVMHKDQLAKKLALCLGGDTMQSEVALNFGLLGCFHDQLAKLPKTEQKQKITLVKRAIDALSLNERKKSFTHCVTQQAIHYLQ